MIEKKGFKHYVISEMVRGYLITKTYLYYSKKEALNLFRQKIK